MEWRTESLSSTRRRSRQSVIRKIKTYLRLELIVKIVLSKFNNSKYNIINEMHTFNKYLLILIIN